MTVLEAFLTEVARIEPWLGIRDGEAVYGPAEERKCRTEPKTEDAVVYKHPSGVIHETNAGLLLFCLGPAIPVNSRVTIAGRTMRVHRCLEMRAWGVHHLEVELE